MIFMKKLNLLMVFLFSLATTAGAQQREDASVSTKIDTTITPNQNVYYGTASYYADKFNGRKTANGETYDGTKFTAACNALPLGTWIRVTNSRNKKSVIVKVNDRLHPRMNRIVDLSRAAAEKLGYIRRGLTQVKVEVLGKKRPV